MATLPKKDWHSIDIEKVCSSIESDLENGLSNESAEEKRLAFGPNGLRDAHKIISFYFWGLPSWGTLVQNLHW